MDMIVADSIKKNRATYKVQVVKSRTQSLSTLQLQSPPLSSCWGKGGHERQTQKGPKLHGEALSARLPLCPRGAVLVTR